MKPLLDSFGLVVFPPALDPRRGVARHAPGVIEPGRDQIALKELAQVQAPVLQAQLHAAPVDGRLEFRGAGEGQRDGGSA